MSLNVPHFRAQGDVLVRGNVIVEENTETAGAEGAGATGTATGTAGAEILPVDTGLVVDLKAEEYDPATPERWNNSVQVDGMGPNNFVLPSTTNQGFIIQDNIGIVSLGNQPSYLRFSGAQLGGFALAFADSETGELQPAGFSWELMIWPELHDPTTQTTQQYVIWSSLIRVIFAPYGDEENPGQDLTLHWNPTTDIIESEVSLRDFAAQGCWNHLVLTYDEPNLKMYWNGVEKLSAERTAPEDLYNPRMLQISRGGVVNNQFQGKYSRVRLYYHALSADEVSQNYAHYNREYLFGGDLTTNLPTLLPPRTRLI